MLYGVKTGNRHSVPQVTRRTVLAGTVASLTAGSRLARAQRRDRDRRLVVIAGGGNNAAKLGQTLGEFGWHGDKLRFDAVSVFNDAEAEAALALGPDVLVAVGALHVRLLLDQTSTIPIVFTDTSDPIGLGFVASRERPGGNVTGLSSHEPPTIRRWLEMLTEITPPVKQVAVLFNPATAPFSEYMLRVLQDAAAARGVSLRAAPCRTEADIRSTMTALARETQSGLVVLPDLTTIQNRSTIHALAAQHRLPTVYPYRFFAQGGGLMSYGHDSQDMWRRVGIFVDRILKGAKPGELPVQAEAVFETTVDRKAAEAMGVSFSPALLAAAEESAAQAQQRHRDKRFLVLAGGISPEGASAASFGQALSELGWPSGKLRFHGTFSDAAALLGPDIVIASGTPAVTNVKRQASATPIVFAGIADPLGSGFAQSLARPGGNITGFIDYDPPLVGKMLELLAQITPAVRRVTVLFSPLNAPFIDQMLRIIEDAARGAGMTVRRAQWRDESEVEAIMAAVAAEAQSGIVVLPQGTTFNFRAIILELAARYRIPAAYPHRVYPMSGGLMSIGVDDGDIWRRAAAYVDRILKGANPGELPIQLPTRFETWVNLKTAKALGITLTPSLLAAADEVIE